MAVYTHLNEDEIAELLTQYDLGELVFSVGIAEGVENSNFLIECEKDRRVTKYILTIYEKRVNPDDLPFFLELMQHLATKGIHCPVPIHTKQDALLAEWQGKPLAIVSFVEGRSRNVFKKKHLGELGKAMAQMHVASDGFGLRRANDLSYDGWQEIADSIEGKLDSIQDGLGGLVSDALARLKTEWPDALPSGVIHADLFPDNVFFKQDNLSGIIDFYFACNDMFAYDLAICLNCWCFEPSGEFNLTKAGQMIRSYDQVRALSEEEKEALPVLATGAALRFLLTRAYDWIHHDHNALVTPKDPLEYARKLEFHLGVKSIVEYGMF
ncbi:MAG: homoserine kinase [Rickettsiales bacterium]|nr:homoserine kinase [Rickettsiales bacterium]